VSERHTPLGAGAEFDTIRAMLARLGPRARGTGDDAAVLDVPRGDALVASVDATVEEVHFRRPWLTPREVGYRATTAALSDLAAMGARPLGVLVAFAVPDAWRADLEAVVEGVGDAVEVTRTHVVGGNLSTSSQFAITITVLGHACCALARAGVRDGQALYVTGRLGGPAAAVRAWLAGRAPAPEWRDRFAHPVARIAEAQWLAAHGATAAIDISDGLAGDAAHLAAASGLTLELDVDRLPCAAGVTARDAAASGEEYELLVAAPPGLDAGEFERTFGVPLTAVGRARVGAPAAVFLDAGARVDLAHAHDHFIR
jgi:thiamine-monophosphate kinase